MKKLNMYKIGIDEAGRGPWLGPVVACSFAFKNLKELPQDFLEGIQDSKKLSHQKREEIFEKLITLSLGKAPQIFFGVGVVDNFVIDEKNIKQANKEAMRRSLLEILRKIPENKISGVLIDGNDNYSFDELKKKPIFVIKGDSKILEISAASIIAKVFRDKLIDTYSLLYPNMGLCDHKGYGTKMHQEYLENSSKITGIHRLSYQPIKKILAEKPKLLLHVCCGPDATIPIVDLKNEYDLLCFWYDPNIQPKEEYEKRFDAFKKVCELEQVPYIKGEYDVIPFFETIRGFENTPEKGKKCELCYDMRLKRSVLEAKKLGIQYWTTTLTISPHKDVKKIFDLGTKHSLKENIEFLKLNFRKNDGFLRSVEYTKTNKIYRQNYCGCIYSVCKKIT